MAQNFYIHPENPQKRFLEQVAFILHDGGVIAFPTDSGYALACLLNNKNGIKRIRQIRDLDNNHNLTLMCRDLSELSKYALVPNNVFRLLKNNTPGQYVFILLANKDVPKMLMSEKNKTIGLRISDNKIDLALLALLDAPLVTTSLILPNETETQFDPNEIDIKLGNKLEAIIDAGSIGYQPTTIVDLTNDFPEILRYGSGDSKPFI